jgi:hypothetical protein
VDYVERDFPLIPEYLVRQNKPWQLNQGPDAGFQTYMLRLKEASTGLSLIAIISTTILSDVITCCVYTHLSELSPLCCFSNITPAPDHADFLAELVKRTFT